MGPVLSTIMKHLASQIVWFAMCGIDTGFKISPTGYNIKETT